MVTLRRGIEVMGGLISRISSHHHDGATDGSEVFD